MLVLLDNGHGKETPGKRSPKWSDMPQIFEWEYNRRLTYVIRQKLLELGHECELLVPEINDISLANRVRRANKYNNCILISVHLNAYDKSESANGWEIYTSGSRKSKAICDSFMKYMDFGNNRGIKTANFYIIQKTKCPAVLTENFFMTNYNDCKFLNSEEGFNKIVDLHVNAINDYIINNE